MAKTVLLILFLIIVSFFSGRTLMLVSALFSKKRADVFSSFCAGSMVILCVSFVSHLLTIMRSGLIADEKKLAGIIMVVVMTVSYFAFVILTVIMGKAGDKKKEKKSSGTAAKAFAVLAVLACVTGLVVTAAGLRVNSVGDETLETVRVFLKGNVMYTVNPLTGAAFTEGVPSRVKILCLPGLYAVMSGAFGTSPELIVHNIAPAFWFLSGLCAFLSLSKSLCSGQDNEILKRSVFMLSAVLILFATDLSAYAQGFAVLSQMYSGPAIRIWVLIPFMLYLLFEKKYITALLPVLCEALICRTQYGIGFCAGIYVLFVCSMLAVRRLKCSKAS